MGDLVLRRGVRERIGHVAASCEEYIVVYGGYFTGADGEDYHQADSVVIFNTETQLWQRRSLKPIPWRPEQQPGRRNNGVLREGSKHVWSDGVVDEAVRGIEEVAVAARAEPHLQLPVQASGSCSVHVAGEDVLYVYGGHSPEGKLSTLLGINLRQLTCWRLPDGPLSVDKLAGWHWENRLYFFGGYGRRPAVGGGGDCLVDIHSFYGYVWLNELVSFDLSRGTWRYERATGTPPSPRAAHTAVRVGRKVYVFGGRSGAIRLNDMHILDLAAMHWSGRVAVKGEVLLTGRSWHTLTAFDEEYLLLYGGFSTDQQVLGDAWLLHVGELTWTKIDRGVGGGPTGQPSLWHTATYSPFSKSVVIFGGCSRNVLGLPAQAMMLDMEDHPVECTATIFHLSPPSLSRLCVAALHKMGLSERLAAAGSFSARAAQLDPPEFCLPRTLANTFARLAHSNRKVVERQGVPNGNTYIVA